MPQRPVLWIAGAVASLGLFAGCQGGVELSPDRTTYPDEKAVAACEALLDALPRSVADQGDRVVEHEEGYGAAWGDPPIVLTCAMPEPAGFEETSACQITNGVAWFIPQEQIDVGEPTEITMTTIGRTANVEVRLPPDYWPPAAAMVDLAAAIKETLPVVRDCR